MNDCYYITLCLLLEGAWEYHCYVPIFLSHRCRQLRTSPEASCVENAQCTGGACLPRNLTFNRPGAVSVPMFPLQARTIRGFCHLYDGQEAVATGVEAALNHQVRCGTHVIMAEALFDVSTKMSGVWYDFSGGRP